jgi:hypothetical protein
MRTVDGRWEFEPGDPVKSQITEWGRMTKNWKHGIVLERYSQRGRFGFEPELYAVRWSDGKEGRGLLHNGLQPDIVRALEKS